MQQIVAYLQTEQHFVLSWVFPLENTLDQACGEIDGMHSVGVIRMMRSLN